MKKIIKKITNLFNYEIVHKNDWYKRKENFVPEISSQELKLIQKISNYSMCSPVNHWAIIQSMKYIKNKKIEGDFVEAGVYKGGNLILLNHYLNLYESEKKIYAYDTFDGMPEENKKVDFDLKNIPVKEIRKKHTEDKWCYASLDEVKKNLYKFDNNFSDKFKFIKGKVENTLLKNENLPEKISFLRLDTDFYESTKIELQILFPRLSSNGILIIDDYGHWKGARKAVDEYFSNDKNFHLFHRIDYSSRILIKD
tara:strand:- start:2636 stop:3397 length:762 start_codon:yes stop_codon:yes gene_type:complete